MPITFHTALQSILIIGTIAVVSLMIPGLYSLTTLLH
jgi:hypothetical protein